MIKPTVDIKEFEKYGFKKCKGSAGEANCYYLCVARGCKMIFLSKEIIDIVDWVDDDPRIHSKPNCKYKDVRTALEIIVAMAQHGLIEVVYE